MSGHTVRWVFGLVLTGLSAAAASAQGLTPSIDTSKLCADPAAPAYKEYWTAVSNEYAIPLPQTVLLPHSQNAAHAKCDLSRVGKNWTPDFADFDSAAKACGYITAVNMALITQSATFCPRADAKKPQCRAIGALRAHLVGRFRSRNDEPPEGAYRLSLGSDYNKTSIEQKTAMLLEDAASWSSGVAPSPTRASLICGQVADKPFRIPVPSVFALAKTPEDVTRPVRGPKRDLTKVNAAELSLAFDRENRTVTERDEDGEEVRSEYDDFVSFNGAIGYNINRSAVGDRDEEDKLTFWNDSVLVSYAALEYAEAFDPTEETDNLALGIRGAPVLGWGESKFISDPVIDFAWVTDIEERESAQWRASVTAGLYWLDTPEALAGYLPIDWTTNAVIDYLHVIDEGDKSSIANVGETIRLGYDVKWELDWTPLDVGDFRPTLSGGYKYRDATEQGGPDADLVTVDLGIIPLKANESGIGLAIGYERGENLTSLEPVEAYKVKLQIKN